MVQRSYSDERQPRPLGALKQTTAWEPNRPYPGSHQAILYSDLRKSQVPNRKKLLIKPPLPKRVVVPETTTQVNTQAASAENSTVAPSDQSEVSDQSDTAPVEQTAVPAEETAEPGEKVERKTEAETDDTADGIPAGQVSGGNPYANILNNKPGSPARITAFTRLPDGEHTVNSKSFTKKDNAFTLDGKVLNAREIERATRAAAEDLKRKSDTGKSAPAEQVGEQTQAPEEWGERHDDLANSGSKGVAELRKRKSGWIPNAWVRDDIGGIALPYGKTDAEVKAENKGRKTGYGLAHIDEGHPDLDWDLADEAIRNGKITEKSGNRIILEHASNDQKHRVVVQIDFDQISQNWLVTVYKKVAESPANPLTTAHDNKGVADNITPENSASNTIPRSAEKSISETEKKGKK